MATSKKINIDISTPQIAVCLVREYQTHQGSQDAYSCNDRQYIDGTALILRTVPVCCIQILALLAVVSYTVSFPSVLCTMSVMDTRQCSVGYGEKRVGLLNQERWASAGGNIPISSLVVLNWRAPSLVCSYQLRPYWTWAGSLALLGALVCCLLPNRACGLNAHVTCMIVRLRAFGALYKLDLQVETRSNYLKLRLLLKTDKKGQFNFNVL